MRIHHSSMCEICSKLTKKHKNDIISDWTVVPSYFHNKKVFEVTVLSRLVRSEALESKDLCRKKKIGKKALLFIVPAVCRNIWYKVFKNGPSKICRRQPVINFTRPIFESFVSSQNL